MYTDVMLESTFPI